MSYNTIDDELKVKSETITTIENEIDNFKNKIVWYDTFDCETMRDIHSKAFEVYQKVNADINNIKTNYKNNDSLLLEVKKRIKSPFNPINLFSKEQLELRKKNSNIIRSQRELLGKLETCKKKHEKARQKLSSIEKDLKKYNEFDKSKYLIAIDTKSVELLQLKDELEILYKHKYTVDNDIDFQNAVEQILFIDKEIDAEIAKREKASKYDSKLSRARNSYERREIHIDSERDLGNGNPKIVIENTIKNIDRLERDKKKIIKRIEYIILRALRKIDHIIIDGNNLCYIDKTYVGLDPLKLLVEELSKREYKVLVVFDASINEKLLRESKTLNNIFDDTMYHVVQSGTSADQTILSIASEEKNSYIVSNDKFRDYWDNPVVKENRIIKYEMLKNRLLVHDLSISLEFKT